MAQTLEITPGNIRKILAAGFENIEKSAQKQLEHRLMLAAGDADLSSLFIRRWRPPSEVLSAGLRATMDGILARVPAEVHKPIIEEIHDAIGDVILPSDQRVIEGGIRFRDAEGGGWDWLFFCEARDQVAVVDSASAQLSKRETSWVAAAIKETLRQQKAAEA